MGHAYDAVHGSDAAARIDHGPVRGAAWFSIRLQGAGWRFSIALGTSTVLAVLLVNVVLSAVVVTHYGYDDGIGILLHGDCDRVSAYNTYAHLLINVLSTLLLSASNYSMQCLTAPSRLELDRAHAKGRALEIGVASLRNLFHIGKAKVLLWVLLAISSLPLHLLYNSVVYQSLAAHSYVVLSTNEAFVQSTNVNVTALLSTVDIWLDDGSDNDAVPNAITLQQKAAKGELQTLHNADCINAYMQSYQLAWGSVIVVSTAAQANQSAHIFGFAFNNAAALDDEPSCAPDPVGWMCPGGSICNNPCINRKQELTGDPSTWSPFGHEALYCLAEPEPQECQVNFSIPLAATVIVFNAIKAAVMLVFLFGYREPRIQTIGDGIHSYLERPDPTTQDMCLKTAADFKPDQNGRSRFASLAEGKAFTAKRERFSKSAGTAQWVFSFAFYVFAVIVCILLLALGLSQSPAHSNLFSLGLGSVSAETVIYWGLPTGYTSGFVANVLVANLPQVVLSLAYLSYNALFTTMLASFEWSKMAWQSRGLRVSDEPQGAQRSTFFLQLPYRYGIPLIVGSSVMHWLVSQALFLVTVTHYDLDGNPLGDYCVNTINCTDSPTHYSCGWSPVAIVCVIVGGLLMVAVALAVGFGFHLKPGMPSGGTSSAVIAAACHVDPSELHGEIPLQFQLLRWGVVRRPGQASGDGDGDGDSEGYGPALHGTPEMFVGQEGLADKSAPTTYVASLFARSPLAGQSANTAYEPVPMGLLASESSRPDGAASPPVAVTTGHCAFSARSPDYPTEGVVYK